MKLPMLQPTQIMAGLTSSLTDYTEKQNLSKLLEKQSHPKPDEKHSRFVAFMAKAPWIDLFTVEQENEF